MAQHLLHGTQVSPALQQVTGKRMTQNVRRHELPVEAGSHNVEMVFRPASVYAGLALSLLTLGAVVVGILWVRKRGG